MTAKTGFRPLTGKKFAQATSATSTSKKSTSRNNFRWEEKHVEDLINCIISYKTKITYRGLDFDGDKPRMYKELRESMAEVYQDVDVKIFGPVNVTDFNENTKSNADQNKNIETIWKEEKELIIRGRNIIIEKVKEIHQNFSKAVTTGTSSGSGKIVYEFFDELVTIWGGSANTKSLQFGVQSGDYANNGGYDSGCNNEEFIENGAPDVGDPPVDRNERSDELSSSGNFASTFEKVTERQNTNKEKVYNNMQFVDVDSQFQLHEESNRLDNKRKHESISKVPKLIDQKRKHLEKNLSAAQRDKLLFEEAKEEASFRRELSDSLKQSNDNFLKAMDNFNKTVSQLGNGLCRSIDMLARAMYMSNQATQNQNVYFPNNLPNVHPIVPQNISQNVSFSRPDSYASYTEWLNESQGQEN